MSASVGASRSGSTWCSGYPRACPAWPLPLHPEAVGGGAARESSGDLAPGLGYSLAPPAGLRGGRVLWPLPPPPRWLRGAGGRAVATAPAQMKLEYKPHCAVGTMPDHCSAVKWSGVVAFACIMCHCSRPLCSPGMWSGAVPLHVCILLCSRPLCSSRMWSGAVPLHVCNMALLQTTLQFQDVVWSGALHMYVMWHRSRPLCNLGM